MQEVVLGGNVAVATTATQMHSTANHEKAERRRAVEHAATCIEDTANAAGAPSDICEGEVCDEEAII